MTIDLDELERLAKAATPGPWRWWTSCSFRRLSSDATGLDGDVLHAVTHVDGVADVIGTEATKEFIAAANPSTVLALVERLREAENALRGAASFVQLALRHADWCEGGRKGMHVPYHGPFAQAVSSPAVVRDLRELETIINAGLEGK